jgi:hypothetical protein
VALFIFSSSVLKGKLKAHPQNPSTFLMTTDRKRGCFSKECDSKRIGFVTLYRPKFPAKSDIKKKRSTPKAFHFVFLALYFFQGYRCIRTVGSKFNYSAIQLVMLNWTLTLHVHSKPEPYENFLMRAERDGFEGKTLTHCVLHLPVIIYL